MSVKEDTDGLLGYKAISERDSSCTWGCGRHCPSQLGVSQAGDAFLKTELEAMRLSIYCVSTYGQKTAW